MEKEYEQAVKILKNNHQETIIPIMEKLNENKKEILAEQILNIDFKEINFLYDKTKTDYSSNFEKIEKIKAINPDDLSIQEINEYMQIGKTAITNGKFCVAIMAGGQGSRLGHDGPKGTFKIDIEENGKYLFELLIDKLRKAKKKYGVYIDCYIMTSEDNNEETVKFFEKNKYFGYPKTHVKFFKQNSTLVIDKNGKIVIGEDYKIKTCSNGNGEIFSSMAKQGIIDEMKRKKIEWVFIGAVDNILLQLVDTMLLGAAIKNKEMIATRTVLKNAPHENVGVFCKQNGKVKVIEYTEMPKKLAEEVNEKGEVVFGEAHIMCNLFNIEALEKASTKNLEYHVAYKKITYLDENGILVRPTEPNCYKFERFIFDAFTLFDNILVLRGKREECFAPIKNAEGIDSPKTAKALYENYMNNIKNKNIKK